MLSRATALTLPLALVACAAPGPYAGEVPTVRPSTTREFGQSAEVLTTDIARGIPVGWEVTVDKPRLVVPSVTCFPVTLTPTFIGEYPEDYTVTLPVIEPVAGDLKANFVPDTSVCGAVERPLSGYVGDLEVGQPMQLFAASWKGDGIPATGVLLTSGEQQVRWGS